jgi:hypothetical protein
MLFGYTELRKPGTKKPINGKRRLRALVFKTLVFKKGVNEELTVQKERIVASKTARLFSLDTGDTRIS